MEYIVNRIFLDMHTVSSQASLRVKKGDTSRKICATLREGGKPYQIADDCYAVFSARKPDGNYIYNDCIIEGNTITYTFTEQTVPLVGNVDCEIVLYNSEGQVITSPRFTITVEDRVYNDEEIVSSPEANAFSRMVAQAELTISSAINKAKIDVNDAVSRADDAVSEVDDAIDKAYYAATLATKAATHADTAISDVKSQAAEAINGIENQADEAINRVYGELDIISSSFANAFKGSKSGAVVQMDDVSPIEHIVGCKVRSKNIYNDELDYLKQSKSTWTYENGELYVTFSYAVKFIELEEEKTYTFSCQSVRNVGDYGGMFISAYDTTKTKNISLYDQRKVLSPTVTFTMPKGYPVVRLLFYVGTGTEGTEGAATYSNIMLEEGPVATGYVPYIDDLSTVKVTRCRRNLLPVPELESKTTNGITFTVNADKSVTCNGTATANATFRLTPVNYKLPFGNYKLVGCPSEGSPDVRLQTNKVINEVGTSAAFDTGAGGTLKVTEECTLYTYIAIISGQTVSNITFKPMLLLEGDTDSSYEVPFFETFTAAADGTVNAMTSLSPDMTILTDTIGTLIDCEYNRDSNKVYEELYSYLQQGGLTKPERKVKLPVLASAWVDTGRGIRFTQAVAVEGVTLNSKVDVEMTGEQLEEFYDINVTFTADNINGTVIVSAVGDKPTEDHILQATIKEVEK